MSNGAAPLRTLAAAWANYEAVMRRAGAVDSDIHNMKNAFYTGSTAVLDVMAGISASNVPDDIGVTVIAGLHGEVRQFASGLLESLRRRG